MGHRLGLARALEKLQISYILWNTIDVKNSLKAQSIVVAPYPKTEHECRLKIDLAPITHVISGGESSVIPASRIRLWYDLKRNPHSLILRCTDKLMMKNYLKEHHIPMTDFMPFSCDDLEKTIETLELPVVCKPKLSSGGRGIVFAKNKDVLKNYFKRAYYFEKILNGNEGSIESLVHNKEIVFTNITEYYKHGLCNKVPSNFSSELKNEIETLNKLVIEALNIRWGMTHLEYYLTPEGVVFGEVALRPPGGYIMEALSYAYGQDFWELFLRVELDMFTDINIKQSYFTSSIIVYPESGTIESLEGVDELSDLQSAKKVKIKVKVGDLISRREGLGHDYGYMIFANKSQKKLNEDIDKAYDICKVLKN